MNTVHTYYEAPGNPCIKNFISSWTRYGWNAHVHTGNTNLGHGWYFDKVRMFVTINPREYEDICYRRWIAYKVNQASGLFADYDVMNYGFTPDDCNKILRDYPTHLLIFSHPDFSGTGILYADTSGIEYIINRIHQHPVDGYSQEFLPKGIKHISDMSIIAETPNIPKHQLLVEYPATGVLVHYGGGKKASIDPAL